MNTVPVWIVCTIHPGGLDNIVTVCVCENSRAEPEHIIKNLKCLCVVSPAVCISEQQTWTVPSTASGYHGKLTLQLGTFAYYLIFQKERGSCTVYLIPTPAPAVGKERVEGERKAAVDHMSSWLSNSKLKRGAISWGPISRKLVLSVGVTPLGGGRGGGGCCWEKQGGGECKLCTYCHIPVCALGIECDIKPCLINKQT